MDRSTIMRLALNLGVQLTDSQLDSLDSAIKHCQSAEQQLEHLVSTLLLYKEERKRREDD